MIKRIRNATEALEALRGVKEVTAWETSDGITHDSKEKAQRHQKELAFEELLQQSGLRVVDPFDLSEFLKANATFIKHYLEKI